MCFAQSAGPPQPPIVVNTPFCETGVPALLPVSGQ